MASELILKSETLLTLDGKSGVLLYEPISFIMLNLKTSISLGGDFTFFRLFVFSMRMLANETDDVFSVTCTIYFGD